MATRSAPTRDTRSTHKNTSEEVPSNSHPLRAAAKKAKPVANKAASVAGEASTSVAGSAYSIIASRVANRLADMAESITFVERTRPAELQAQDMENNRRPRKLEMRLGSNGQESITFSAPFLDNTLQKMLSLQTRMLKSASDLSKSENVEETLVKEHAAQSADLSRIIALICAEKARQGA